MSRPVTCFPGTPLRGALSLMRKRGIGGLVVVAGDDHLLGMLTRASLAEAVLLREAKVDDAVVPAACQQAHTVEPNTPLWQVQEMQQQLRDQVRRRGGRRCPRRRGWRKATFCGR